MIQSFFNQFLAMSQSANHQGGSAGLTPESIHPVEDDDAADFASLPPSPREEQSSSPIPSAQDQMRDAVRLLAVELKSQMRAASSSSSPSDPEMDLTPPVVPEGASANQVFQQIEEYGELLKSALSSHRNSAALIRAVGREMHQGRAPPQGLPVLSLARGEHGSTAFLAEMSHDSVLASLGSHTFGAYQMAIQSNVVTPGQVTPLIVLGRYLAATQAYILQIFEELSLLNMGHRIPALQQAMPFLGSGQIEPETSHPRWRRDVEMAIPNLPALPPPPPRGAPKSSRGRSGGRGQRPPQHARGPASSSAASVNAVAPQQGWVEHPSTSWSGGHPEHQHQSTNPYVSAQYASQQWQAAPFQPPPPGAPPYRSRGKGGH